MQIAFSFELILQIAESKNLPPKFSSRFSR
jgi:hypothetical protein